MLSFALASCCVISRSSPSPLTAPFGPRDAARLRAMASALRQAYDMTKADGVSGTSGGYEGEFWGNWRYLGNCGYKGLDATLRL